MARVRGRYSKWFLTPSNVPGLPGTWMRVKMHKDGFTVQTKLEWTPRLLPQINANG